MYIWLPWIVYLGNWKCTFQDMIVHFRKFTFKEFIGNYVHWHDFWFLNPSFILLSLMIIVYCELLDSMFVMTWKVINTNMIGITKVESFSLSVFNDLILPQCHMYLSPQRQCFNFTSEMWLTWTYYCNQNERSNDQRWYTIKVRVNSLPFGPAPTTGRIQSIQWTCPRWRSCGSSLTCKLVFLLGTESGCRTGSISSHILLTCWLLKWEKILCYREKLP